MGRKTFTFSNVVNVKKIGEIFKKFEGEHTLDDVQFFTCYEEHEYDDDPGRTHLKGMVQFVRKRDDAKRWFNSAIGNMLWWRLLVLPVTDVNKYYNYVNKLRAEVENGRTFEFGEFVGQGKKRGHDGVEEEDDGVDAIFNYFVKGGARGALVNHFPLTKILKIPIAKIEKEAQDHKKWLKSQEKIRRAKISESREQVMNDDVTEIIYID